jgi:hypothetical protein
MNLKRIKQLLPQIEEIIKLTREFNALREGGDKAFDKRQSIVGYLSTFEYSDIVLLETLMYIGRDDYIPKERYEDEGDYYQDIDLFNENYDPSKAVDNMYKYLYDQDRQSVIIDHMLAKFPLPKYLEQGLHVLRIKRMYY